MNIRKERNLPVKKATESNTLNTEENITIIKFEKKKVQKQKSKLYL